MFLGFACNIVIISIIVINNFTIYRGALFSVSPNPTRDVPFRQPLQLQYSHHGSTKAYLCSSLFLISFSTTMAHT